MGPLEGLKVVDLSRVIAGPYCSMLLGDLGADIIKVERPDGEGTRGLEPIAAPLDRAPSIEVECLHAA